MMGKPGGVRSLLRDREHSCLLEAHPLTAGNGESYPYSKADAPDGNYPLLKWSTHKFIGTGSKAAIAESQLCSHLNCGPQNLMRDSSL